MSWTEHYSAIDRVVHNVAFAGIGMQKVVADIEDSIFKSQFAAIQIDRPVFITSLPRAGTTLLLELLTSLPQFASHTYRNMPFLLCPLMWHQLSHGFQQQSALRPRAHDDGILIDFNSAEAFEEALWQAWWPEKYQNGRIALWQRDEYKHEYADFFDKHLRKIIALGRNGKKTAAGRYISKNNANIARIETLTSLYPDCQIIVPVREPLEHVRSLHRQHMRFLQAHAEDKFSRKYMRAIGHLEFGANLYPIEFPGFELTAESAQDPSFWLEYWITAYSMVLSINSPNIKIISFDQLCRQPVTQVEELLVWLDVGSEDLTRLAGQVTMPSSQKEKRPQENLEVSPERLKVARELYRRVLNSASVS